MSRRHTSGWVVCQSVWSRKQTVTSWWCGPERSWGTTFGPLIEPTTNTLSMSVAVFPARETARDALRAIGLRGCEVVRLDDAIDSLTLRAAS